MPQYSFLGTHTDSLSVLHRAIARFHYRNVELEDLVALDRDPVSVDRDFEYLCGILNIEHARDGSGGGELAALEAFDRAKLAEAIDDLVIERALYDITEMEHASPGDLRVQVEKPFRVHGSDPAVVKATATISTIGIAKVRVDYYTFLSSDGRLGSEFEAETDVVVSSVLPKLERAAQLRIVGEIIEGSRSQFAA